LARKAADAYDPEAHDYLARVYSLIFECEMALNRPVAARAALKSVQRYDPADEELRQRFEAIFGPQSALPACAREEYKIQGPSPSCHPDYAAHWVMPPPRREDKIQPPAPQGVSPTLGEGFVADTGGAAGFSPSPKEEARGGDEAGSGSRRAAWDAAFRNASP